MNAYKLEKGITLYKVQFDKYCLNLFKEYRLDRLSLDVDGLLFNIKYMIMNKKDLDKIHKMQEEFTDKACQLHKSFSEFLYMLIAQVVGIPEPFKLDDLEDILAHDVKIDTNYVKFKMVVISQNKDFLEYIDNSIPEDKPYNIDPLEYFRFYTDSYNDGVAKAYPELFENRHQDIVGTGADGDVFVHNFTFQTSERCSLNCTYCFAAGTKILMEDGSTKNIEDIKISDMVMGFPEYRRHDEALKLSGTEVTSNLMKRKSKVYRLKCEKVDDLIVTGEHPMLSWDNRWIQVKDLKPTDILVMARSVNKTIRLEVSPIISIEELDTEIDVYNFETFKHTYIANNILTHNCYQFNKTPMKMSFDTAKTFIDNLLADKYGYINRYNSPAIIIEFIGGEPLMEIKLTRKIYEYFLDQCYELNHPWFTLHRVSICSNGLQYFDKEVQDFFKEYAQNVSFNISIDGNKELHDACRIQPNGEGSYDIDIAALNHYNRHYTPERNSKMTLAPSNIKYLFDSVVNFINNGMTCININCVFEEGWNQKTALIEYQQLKKLADYILENNLENLYIAIFNERQEDVFSKYNDSPSCGGSGSMLSLRPNGQFYPCIRYMPTSVGNKVKDLCIGNINDGIDGRDQDSEILKMLDNITRRSYTNDICYECPLSNDCGACTALGHTVFGTPNKKATFICIQMVAEHLANIYYWNNLALKHPEYDLPVRKNVVPDEWALLVIDKNELDELKLLECMAIAKCIENK